MREQLLDLKSAFPDLDDYILHELEKIAHVRILAPQEVLYHYGEVARSFYVVLNGAVRLVQYNNNGSKIVTLKIYGHHDIFGLLAISGAYRHPNEVNAICRSTIAAFDGKETRHLMMQHPKLALYIMDLLVNHVHHAYDRLNQMAAQQVSQRLAHALLQLTDKFGNVEEGYISIDLPISQQEIAEFVGASVETINRVLSQWEKQGVLKRSRQHIDILDFAALNNLRH
ncbi:MAG: Crp/Fnr family transcriptional regulator [Phototrophicales bacterium]